MKTILIDTIDTFIIPQEGIFISIHTLLETYLNPKILLTSADDEQMKIFGLDTMPYPIFTQKHNPEKTDPLYYKNFLQQSELTVNDVVYFEHNPEAVESARSVGIITYHYDSKAKNMGKLQQFLNENLSFYLKNSHVLFHF